MAESRSSSSLLPRLEHAARSGHSITFVGSAGEHGCEPVEWARLHDDARAMAAALQRRGIGPGSHVALLGPRRRPLVTAIQAMWLAGGAVVALPLPMRLGSIEEFVAQTRRAHRATPTPRSSWSTRTSRAFLEPQPGDPPFVSPRPSSRGPRRRAMSGRPDDPDALAILQFTSGSTPTPRA